MDSIILAGGYGTRLKSEIEDIPKPLAPINKIPFLDYLFDFLINNDIKVVILSVFYKYELIQKKYNKKYKSIKISYSIDKSKYGTGGAIKKASTMANTENILIINGDTYFDIKISDLCKEHYRRNNHITMALKPMENFDRYGYVERDVNGRIISFSEKKFCKKGFIDGGIYLIKKSIFSDSLFGESFSFNNFMIKNMDTLKIGSKVFDNFFIDIGTPEDFQRAQTTLGINT